MGSLAISWTTNSAGYKCDLQVLYAWVNNPQKRWLNEQTGFFGNAGNEILAGSDGIQVSDPSAGGGGGSPIDHQSVNQAARIAQAAMQR